MFFSVKSLRNYVSFLLNFTSSAILHTLIKGLIWVFCIIPLIRNKFHNHRFSDRQLIDHLWRLAVSRHQSEYLCFYFWRNYLKLHGRLNRFLNFIFLWPDSKYGSWRPALFRKIGRNACLMGCFQLLCTCHQEHPKLVIIQGASENDHRG